MRRVRPKGFLHKIGQLASVFGAESFDVRKVVESLENYSKVAHSRYLAELGWQRLMQASNANLVLGLETPLLPSELKQTKALLGDAAVAWHIVASSCDAAFLSREMDTVIPLKELWKSDEGVPNLCVAQRDISSLAASNEGLVYKIAAKCRNRLLLFARTSVWDAHPDFATSCEGVRMGQVTGIAAEIDGDAIRRLRVALHRAGFHDVVGPVGVGSQPPPISRANDGLGNHRLVRSGGTQSGGDGPYAHFQAYRLPLGVVG